VYGLQQLGHAFLETEPERADLETVVSDPMSGQYGNPVRVVAFSTAERQTEDASEDIACVIMRWFDLAGDEVPCSLKPFVQRHFGPERQLTLGLA
jgi:hypothetical protein